MNGGTKSVAAYAEEFRRLGADPSTPRCLRSKKRKATHPA